MKAFFKVFFVQWKILINSPKQIFIVLGVPLLLFSFLGYILKNDLPTELPVAVADYDQSSMSRELLRMLDATSIMKINKSIFDLQESKNQLSRGDIYAYIIIPSDFEKHILQGKLNKVICYTNGQYLLPSGFIQSDFLSVVSLFSAGINLEKRLKNGEAKSQALGQIQRVGSDSHLLYNPYKNYNFYLNLGFIPMLFQLLVMIATILAIGKMFKDQSALTFLEFSKGSYWTLLLGKLMPYTLIFFFIAFTMNIFLFKIIGIPVGQGSLLGITILSILLVIIYQIMAVFFISMASDLRSALTFGGGFSALAFSFSGYTFPIDSMPLGMKIIAQFFPFTHFIQAYVSIAIKGMALHYSFWSLISLCLFSLTLCISFPKFKKLVKNNGYKIPIS